MIVRISTTGSFARSGKYFLHDVGKETSERVGFVHTENMPFRNDVSREQDIENGGKGLRMMAYTYFHSDQLKQEKGVTRSGQKQNKQPGAAINLSWHPADKPPTKDEMIKTSKGLLKTLGLEKHEAIIVSHTDQLHPHVHILTNLINPEDGRKNNLSHSNRLASRYLLELQKERGREMDTPNRVKNQKTERDKAEALSVIRGAYDKAKEDRKIVEFRQNLREHAYDLVRLEGSKDIDKVYVKNPKGQLFSPQRALDISKEDYRESFKGYRLGMLKEVASTRAQDNPRAYEEKKSREQSTARENEPRPSRAKSNVSNELINNFEQNVARFEKAVDRLEGQQHTQQRNQQKEVLERPNYAQQHARATREAAPEKVQPEKTITVANADIQKIVKEQIELKEQTQAHRAEFNKVAGKPRPKTQERERARGDDGDGNGGGKSPTENFLENYSKSRDYDERMDWQRYNLGLNHQDQLRSMENKFDNREAQTRERLDKFYQRNEQRNQIHETQQELQRVTQKPNFIERITDKQGKLREEIAVQKMTYQSGNMRVQESLQGLDSQRQQAIHKLQMRQEKDRNNFENRVERNKPKGYIPEMSRDELKRRGMLELVDKQQEKRLQKMKQQTHEKAKAIREREKSHERTLKLER